MDLVNKISNFLKTIDADGHIVSNYAYVYSYEAKEKLIAFLKELNVEHNDCSIEHGVEDENYIVHIEL